MPNAPQTTTTDFGPGPGPLPASTLPYRAERNGRSPLARLVSYAAAFFASLIGWQIGRKFGPAAGFFLSTVLAGVGMYAARRWWRQNIG
jgi:hypothetical protein